MSNVSGMQEWIKRLPWWAKWAFTAGLGLMSAFAASVLPAPWALIGFCSGIALVMISIVGAGWHSINELVATRGKPRLKLEPIHIIALGVLISLGGVVWQLLSSRRPPETIVTTSQSVAINDAVVLDPELVEGGFGASESPLILTGTYARSGRSIKFAIDISIDTQNRGSSLRRVPRIKIGEVNDFVRGQAVNVVVVSYFNQDRSAPMWGPRRALSGIDDETFQFTSFVKAAIFAIDENGHETRILGFTLYPRVSGTDLMNRIAGPTLSTWRNFIVYRDGSLRSMDSTQ